ncbi:TetR/AcrR family transcriptional regulator [Actinoplanes sp. NPDC048988]|uniref:TetR/AcrR family transcriptional regulator n=1 Tax=Actinoplanes sp. NPDC048988 TaxID=3363901 RepID=UPI0037237DD9
MVRLTRAQQQERTRAAVLTAAAAEFAEHGYAEARVDRIAARAELTRGAVYSNFPSKRSLYLAVLLDSLPGPTAGDTTAVEPVDVAGGAESFARVWLERLPLSGEAPPAGRLRALSVTGVFEDGPGRTALAEVTRLESLLLALALESCRARPPGRRVRLAEMILTLLHGANHLAQTAPGFGDPFDVARACRHLATLAADDVWAPAHLPYVAAARQCHDAWTPPPTMTDEITGAPAGPAGPGVVVLLGTGRLSAAEEAIRAARPGEHVTVAVVTADPAESGALTRLRIADLAACLRRVFGPAFRPSLSLVLDDRAALASALGVEATDDTEAAVRVTAGHIVARAHGRGAAYAAATAPIPADSEEERR